MKWLVLVCFAFFAIGLFGFLINICRGKSPWKQSDGIKSVPYDQDEDFDDDNGGGRDLGISQK